MDWMEQEQERGITITSAATTCVVEATTASTSSTRPGHVDFTSRSSARCASSTAPSPCSTGRRRRAAVRDGVAPGRQVRRAAHRFINKMDRTAPTSSRCVESMVDRLGAHPLPIQLPIGAEGTSRGVVDLVEMKALVWRGEDLGESGRRRDPRRPGRAGREYRHQLIDDARAEADDELMEKYLEEEEITADDLKARAPRARSPTRSCPSSAAPRSRTRACSRCSTRSSTTCRARSTSPPIVGIDPRATRSSSASRRRRAVLGARVQDHDRPARRQAHLLPRLLRHAQGRATGLNTTKGKKERIGRILQMHANHREEIATRSAPATSSPASASRTPRPATRSRPENARSCSSR
jgi:elongation factor G